METQYKIVMKWEQEWYGEGTHHFYCDTLEKAMSVISDVETAINTGKTLYVFDLYWDIKVPPKEIVGLYKITTEKVEYKLKQELKE
mgnify:CR=1 FL=1